MTSPDRKKSPVRQISILSIFVAAIGFTVAGAPAYAADVEGSQDHPLIGARFPEAQITAQKADEFDEFMLITGPVEREGEVISGERLEGRVTATIYEIPAERTTLEVFRNYENKLAELGMETLYACSDKDCGGRNFNLTAVPYINGFGGNEKGQRYLAARHDGAGSTAYVSLYVAKNYSVGGPTKDLVYVRLVVIEVESMSTALVVVDADEMQRQIFETGRVALYGIQFGFDSADILPESQEALTEIAKLLEAQPSLELVVVGHTDNVGSLDYNMNLSKQRADAVQAALVNDYGIAGARLDSWGVGYLSPVATNQSEDGRALNRRVELVER